MGIDEVDAASDKRNVADEFKGLSVDTIRLQMQPRRTPLVNIATNLTSDFNKSSIMRAGEAHAAREFVLLNRVNEQHPDAPEGIKRYDRRGAVGMHNYANLRHVAYPRWEELFASYRAEGYSIFAIDNVAAFNPKPIYDAVLPEKSAFIYGEEGPGLPGEIIEACDEMLYIPQFGVVRSLNVAQAAAICMYEYSRQHRPQL